MRRSVEIQPCSNRFVSIGSSFFHWGASFLSLLAYGGLWAPPGFIPHCSHPRGLCLCTRTGGVPDFTLELFRAVSVWLVFWSNNSKQYDALAEWLRCSTANRVGLSCMGSNPICIFHFCVCTHPEVSGSGLISFHTAPNQNESIQKAGPRGTRTPDLSHPKRESYL